MKVVLLLTPYSKYLDGIYSSHAQLKSATSSEQTAFINNDAFAWCGVWEEPFRSQGYDVETIYSNAVILQSAWARENSLDDQIDPDDILKRRLEVANPDIILTDNIYKFNNEWIAEIRARCSSVKYIMGFICSPAYDTTKFWQYDIIFTCLRSIEKELKEARINVWFMPLGFDRNILKKVDHSSRPDRAICFYGGFLRGANSHGYRERIITDIVNKQIPIHIYSDVINLNETRYVLGLKIRRTVYFLFRLLERMKVMNFILKKGSFHKRIAQWEGINTSRFDRELKASLRPALYGLDLFKTISKYQAVFNAHGDLAAEEAANLRMFEVTGMGRCLITDWKPNIELYFRDGVEILTYKTEEECLGKIKWVIDHPKEAAVIAQAGQKRTLTDHTYECRIKDIFQAIETLESKKRKELLSSQ